MQLHPPILPIKLRNKNKTRNNCSKLRNPFYKTNMGQKNNFLYWTVDLTQLIKQAV